MKEKSLKSFIGMSAISLAVILIVLAIACFAVLTYVSADSEYKLSEKSSAAVDDYYRADALANEKLREISAAIKKENLEDFAAKKGYNVTNTARNKIVSFQVPVGNTKMLQAEVSFKAPKQWEILKWEIVISSRPGED